MPALATTTLAGAIDATTDPVKLASTANVAVGDLLFTGGEALRVMSVASPWVRVQRGSSGTSARAHPDAATVYVGQPHEFYVYDPVGVPPAQPLVTPWINLITGAIWTVVDGAWVNAAGDVAARLEAVEDVIADGITGEIVIGDATFTFTNGVLTAFDDGQA